MKKLLISLLFINIFTVGVSAETYTGSHSIRLSAIVEPTYCVKIPKKLNISENTTYFNYYVSGDIYADQMLKIDYDHQVYITSSDKSYLANITLDKDVFHQYELSNDYAMFTGQITHPNLESGKYTGQINVVISLIGGI